MKIVHLCLAAPYRENMGYQENMLVKWHVAMGHEVAVLTQKTAKYTQNTQEYGATVYRLTLKERRHLSAVLEALRPDFIMIHGTQFREAYGVARFLKNHPKVRAKADNHCDDSNSARTFLTRFFLHRGLWRRTTQCLLPYIEVLYGVLPARVTFLEREYHVPPSKTALLPMGADPSYRMPDKANRLKQTYRKEGEILLVTGGKIDRYKRETAHLIRAVRRVPGCRLIIFGTLDSAMKKVLEEEVCERIRFIGWQSQEAVACLLQAADVAVFAGRHSVLWEEAAGYGTPLIVKAWEGTRHIAPENSANCIFLTENTQEEMERVLKDAIMPDTLAALTRGAKAVAERFWYDRIAAMVLKKDEDGQNQAKKD